jgi:hypothetical protein
MNIDCKDRERIFLDGSTEGWAALEQHATSCQVCAEEISAWRALSIAAQELREYDESPALWSRIESSLVAQASAPRAKGSWRDWFSLWRPTAVFWQTALAGALIVALGVSGGYLYIHRQTQIRTATSPLLKGSALGQVERAEQAYASAIEKLEAETKAQLDNSSSPLMASYREKLVVLDSAIDELRLETGQNPSNAHLRRQLLAMYQEKQDTLEEILESKR